jgi:DsbC/DsbD-like thiol-disulfide interchange protein
MFAVLSGVGTSAWAETHSESYTLPGHGALQLSLPEGWKGEARQPGGGLPPTITLAPKAGPPFQVLITPIWPMQGSIATDDKSLRKGVEGAAAEAQPQAVEPKLTVKALGGASGHGFYFTATDRAPKPGEFKYLAQGMILVGDITLAFTVLTNDGQSEVVSSALQLLTVARHQ